ncbi:ATP-dependent Clp protease proteolytic subunit, putative [Plasmodium chabaudi chabaudi]|uniref:ATP-dependent Clp protease proteolytic subunit n=2 Tax=Plasmodium chabaudi TaxID=5825 RepID=A0A077THZ8_PLACU|nr:ATP-dependent Clp protease proteolytic subunit, putative [Plasmodium chabaudi chabaudi]SCM19803.1 ATP-dependent Clp protease proteolytic subunit, putative [Plasmodium chabaudi chabaudi]SCN59045.1 ATP-dependent Clp protease proteolytic subunit, putative [Plasmodium chabaudi adami]SCN59046.1 ATP-dependent Clp protease proteolytic subunit, putative [Plasmodium chabaudi chabaudi]VTZ67733.1 ATP-dependent Clp protease proteolytic subunit, putative [Plasmodium chabaudi chabaudi]|eukprot:XP_741542.2 ATP-dependent Clp protease proteolytic subunit, putative [Plasmodium chabaudi chabaudi]
MRIFWIFIINFIYFCVCKKKKHITPSSFIIAQTNNKIRLRNKLRYYDNEYPKQNISIPSLLLSKRIIFLSSPIYPHISEQIISQLLYLEYESKRKPIHLYINSTGDLENNKIVNLNGITDVISIVDVINYISSDVYTYCLGKAYGIACILASSGKKGYRFSLKNSSFCLKQSYSIIPFNQATNIEIQNKEIMNTKKKVIDIIAKNTEKDSNIISEILDRDRYFNAKEASDFNLIDHILEKQ